MIVVFQKTIKSVIISFSFIICKCCSLHYFIWSCGKTFLITTYFSVRFGPAALMRCVQLGNSTLLRFLIMKVDSHLDQLIRIIWNNSKKDNDTSVGVIRCFNKLLFFFAILYFISLDIQTCLLGFQGENYSFHLSCYFHFK